jgi:CelD/BcsL family acetyltransferase involved in cellulose biosynthesis
MSDEQQSERFRVDIARTVDDVESLRGAWDTVPWGTDEAELDLFLARLNARNGVIGPFAVLVSADGKPAAAAVGRIESGEMRTNLGYRVVYAPTVRMLRIVDGGLVATDSGAVAPLLEALEAALADGEAEAITLPALPVDSDLFAAVSQLGGRLERQRFLSTWTHRRLVLPASADDFLASRSWETRRGIRKTANRLQKSLGEELRFEILRDPSSLDQLVRDLDRISEAAYQRALGAGFSDTPEQRALAQAGLEKGRLRAYVLYRGDEPIAYWLCGIHGGTMFLKTTGFDHAYASHRVGIYLLMHLIEDACADPALAVIDFGPGDAPYKQQFSNESDRERSVVVFARTFRGRRINAWRTAILGAGLLARRAADAADLTERIKSRWRGRLRKTS